jgi:hypothetical protein
MSSNTNSFPSKSFNVAVLPLVINIPEYSNKEKVEAKLKKLEPLTPLTLTISIPLFMLKRKN